jgi:IS5 family transposase
MNKQKTFTDMEYAQRKRTGRREKFLDAIIPRTAFEKTIKPFYPKSGLRGRQPKGTGLMLPDVFSASPVQFGGRVPWGEHIRRRAMGKFMRPDYSREDAPDAVALPHFRHPHGEHDPRKELFRTLKATLIKSWGRTEIERGNRGFLTKRAVFLLKPLG